MLNFLLIIANIGFLFLIGLVISILTVNFLQQFWGDNDRNKIGEDKNIDADDEEGEDKHNFI